MDRLSLDDVMELSPYDDSFPAQFLQVAFEYKTEEANRITRRVYCDVINESKNTMDISELSSSEEKMRLVVDVSDDFLKDYKSETITLAKEKGHTVAQIKNGNKYGSKLPIREENYLDGPDSLSIQNALQLQALGKELRLITYQIEAIDENVKEVLRGQQNDRLALFYSGVAQFIEAYNTSDELFRRQLMSQSIKTLTDSVYQLTLSLQSDINYLERKEYDKNKKFKYNLINEKIENINRAFMAIHQASIMKTAIYFYQGELKAVATVLQEYKRFISGTIEKNANMLLQCDSNPKRIQDQVWDKRSKIYLEVDHVVKQLRMKDPTLYICNKEEMGYESI